MKMTSHVYRSVCSRVSHCTRESSARVSLRNAITVAIIFWDFLKSPRGFFLWFQYKTSPLFCQTVSLQRSATLSTLSFFECKTDGIHAVALTGGRRSVIKYMSEMGTTPCAYPLCPTHPMRIIRDVFHSARERLIKTRPSRTGVKFCIR